MTSCRSRGDAELFRSRSRARGYTMVALLIGIAILMIGIAAVLPLASTQAQRDKEEELIFRGQQYVEGIRIFRKRFGRAPNSLKEMYEVRPRSLRKLWKDPITDSNDWGLVTQATTTAIRPPNPPGGPRMTPTPTPTPAPTRGFGGKDDSGTPNVPLPIIGVYSKSTKKSIRVYDGRDTYNEWRFTDRTAGVQLPVGAPR